MCDIQVYFTVQHYYFIFLHHFLLFFQALNDSRSQLEKIHLNALEVQDFISLLHFVTK